MPMNAVQTFPQRCRLNCLIAAPAKNGRSSSHRFKHARQWTPPKAMDERQLFGDNFGARDPTAGETESNFTDKVLGNADTSHIIRGPKGLEKLVGLATRKCVPCEKGNVQPMDESSAYKLRNQVPGWRVEKTKEGTLCLRQDWKVKNFRCGIDLFKRIGEVAEAEGHHPDLHLEGYNMVSAELSTHSIGGLSDNDFIMAAKINSIPMADLQPKAKPRFWA